MLIAKPTAALLIATLSSTVLFILLSSRPNLSPRPDSMARSFVLWLHGLGDSGPANEPIKTLFTSPEFRNAIWSFPSAPSNPVTCNCEFTCSVSIASFCDLRLLVLGLGLYWTIVTKLKVLIQVVTICCVEFESVKLVLRVILMKIKRT